MGELIDFKAYKANRHGGYPLTKKRAMHNDSETVVVPFRPRPVRRRQSWDFSKILQDTYKN